MLCDTGRILACLIILQRAAAWSNANLSTERSVTGIAPREANWLTQPLTNEAAELIQFYWGGGGKMIFHG